ncbi:MAG: nucleoside deaminase [Bacteroidota bacterium]
MRQEFMMEAIRLSLEGVRAGDGGPFGCVVVKDGKIVGRGNNRVTSTNDPTAHAEVTAIRDACKNLGTHQLEGCEIYTSCEPCPMCLGAIYWARPAAVYYAASREDAAASGFDDSFIYDEVPLPISERKISMKQLLPDEAIKAFQAWDEKSDKVEY